MPQCSKQILNVLANPRVGVILCRFKRGSCNGTETDQCPQRGALQLSWG
jgi:hypothetical protein